MKDDKLTPMVRLKNHAKGQELVLYQVDATWVRIIEKRFIFDGDQFVDDRGIKWQPWEVRGMMRMFFYRETKEAAVRAWYFNTLEKMNEFARQYMEEL